MDNKPDFTLYKQLFKELKDNTKKIKFNRTFLPVTTIAAQSYCEKKVEFEEQCGKKTNSAMQTGKQGHTADLLLSDPIKIEKAWNEVTRQNKRKSYSIREFPVPGKYKNLYILGIIDRVTFFRGKVLSLTEFKFRPTKRTFPNDLVQTNIYGYLLNQLGFETNALNINIALFPPEEKDIAILMWDSNEEYKKKTTISHVFNFQKAESNLKWASRYWNNKREAIPVKSLKNKNKCGHCEYKNDCQSALI